MAERDEEKTKEDGAQTEDAQRTKPDPRDPERDEPDGPWAKTSSGSADDITDS
jgi:hypothetical protein